MSETLQELRALEQHLTMPDKHLACRVAPGCAFPIARVPATPTSPAQPPPVLIEVPPSMVQLSLTIRRWMESRHVVEFTLAGLECRIVGN